MKVLKNFMDVMSHLKTWQVFSVLTPGPLESMQISGAGSRFPLANFGSLKT